MKTQTFEDAVNEKVDQMTKVAQNNVRKAIAEGAEVFQLGRYYIGGPLLIFVKVAENSKHFPPHWFGRFNKERILECRVNLECEQKTIEWVKKKYPSALIAA